MYLLLLEAFSYATVLVERIFLADKEIFSFSVSCSPFSHESKTLLLTFWWLMWSVHLIFDLINKVIIRCGFDVYITDELITLGKDVNRMKTFSFVQYCNLHVIEKINCKQRDTTWKEIPKLSFQRTIGKF